MNNFRIFLTLFLVFASFGCTTPRSKLPQVEIEAAWVRAATMVATDVQSHDSDDAEQQMSSHANGANSAAYMTIRNRGKEADKLISVTSEVAESAEMHLSQTDNDIATMKMVASIEIPALGQTELKPGGYHIMLIGLKGNLIPSDKVTLQLQFEKSGQLEVIAEVREP